MRLPNQLTYNDLNGSEIKQILVDWFSRLLDQQPYLLPHQTLPRVKLVLDCTLYQWADAPAPEPLSIHGEVTVDNNETGSAPFSPESALPLPPVPLPPVPLHAEVDASPSPGGHPPDQVRDTHGLAIPRPSFGPRETGSHLFVSDGPAPTQVPARAGDVAEGFVFSTETPPAAVLNETSAGAYGNPSAIRVDPTGESRMHLGRSVIDAPSHVAASGPLKHTPYGSVTGTLDPGPAGLTQGNPPRSKDQFPISRKTS